MNKMIIIFTVVFDFRSVYQSQIRSIAHNNDLAIQDNNINHSLIFNMI